MAAREQFLPLHIANCVLNAFLSYTAIMLNSVTIHAIRKNSTLPKTLKTLLLSLAVSDLGVGLLAQPLHIASIATALESTAETNPANNAVLLVFRLSTNLFVFASFFGVTTLSTDIFLAMHFHLRYQELVTYRRVVGVVISVWLCSAFASLGRLCIPESIIFVIFATSSVACFVITTFLNYKIFKALRYHGRQIQALRINQEAENVEMTNAGRIKKSAVTAIYIYLVFLACYLPNIWMLLIIFKTGSTPLNDVLQEYTVTLVFLNSSLNPLIYCWKMRPIRRTVIALLRNTFKCHNWADIVTIKGLRLSCSCWS